MPKDIDVDLESLLDDKSGDVVTPVASDENLNTDKPVSEDVKPPVEPEASARANERIRELLEENKKLKEFNTQSDDLELFVSSIEDEPSKNLMRRWGSLLEKRIDSKINPVVSDYNISRFEKDFSSFADKLPELASHKSEMLKTYLRDPSQSIKSIVGDTLLDLQTSKIKPIEKTISQASRSAVKIADVETKEDLYALLETLKN